MTDALQNCPFCGAKPLLYDLLDTHGGFSVECPTDGCDTEKMRHTKKETVAAWSRRAAIAAPPGWVLVPVEPSKPMLLAGAVADCGPDDDGVHRLEPWLKALWAAMLAAAPDAQKEAS